MVITYAKSSKLEADEKFWKSFDLIIFDEVHHLAQPGAWQRLLVPAFQAPFALGLTATPPTDPENIMLRTLPILYTRTLAEGTDEGYAAPIEVRPVPIKLVDEERKRYTELTEMIRLAHVEGGSPARAYTALVGEDPENPGQKLFGGQVMTRRKQLVAMAEEKFERLTKLIMEIGQPNDRIFVWSEYVDALEHAKDHLDVQSHRAEWNDGRAYQYTSAIVTGKTPKAERKRLLTEEWGKSFRILLVAKIGEEGLDYPEVELGVILAGARTTRQNMQRIGRLLRPSPGKNARLWVIFAEATFEEKLLNMIDMVSGD